MTPTDSRFEKVRSPLRRTRPATVAKASSADSNESWKRLALKSMDGSYFQSGEEFVLFVEACLRYVSIEQSVQNRAYALVVRDLAETLARHWTCGTAPENAPTAEEIAGLLQSEWVTSGQFRSLRSAGAECDAK